MADVLLPPVDARGVVVLISGWRRVGKTTLLQTLRAAALEAGLRMGGFLSPARFVNGVRTGIDVMDAATGDLVALAAVSDEPHAGENGPRTGHYIFTPDGLAAGLHFAAAGSTADVFLVDELGPLELVRGEGWAEVLPLIRARTFGAALVVVRPELVDAARTQLALPPETPVIMVDEETLVEWAILLSDWLIARGQA